MTYFQKRQAQKPRIGTSWIWIPVTPRVCAGSSGVLPVLERERRNTTRKRRSITDDSGREAKVAMELDWRPERLDIKGWERHQSVKIAT
jgi:hypothetical protein